MDMTVQELQDKIAANSKAWHDTDDDKERDRLHRENVDLHAQLDAQTGSQSSFDSGSGRWTVTAAGAGDYQGVGAPEVRDLSGQVEVLQRAATQQALVGLERAKEDSGEDLSRAREEVEATYASAKNRTAAQNEIERRNTNAWASDKGLSTGAAGQIALSQSVAAQGELAALEAQEAQELAALADRRSQMERDYDLAVAEAEAEGDYALADALYREASRFDQAQRDAWREQEDQAMDIYELNRANRQYDTKLQLDQEQRDYDRSQDDWEHRFREDQRDYDRGQDALDRAEKAEQTAWDRERDLVSEGIRRQQVANTAANQRRDDLVAIAKSLAAHGDFRGYLQLGYSQSQVESMEALWRGYMEDQ